MGGGITTPGWSAVDFWFPYWMNFATPMKHDLVKRGHEIRVLQQPWEGLNNS